MSCPTCGGYKGGKVFIVGRNVKCEECIKVRDPEEMEELREKNNYVAPESIVDETEKEEEAEEVEEVEDEDEEEEDEDEDDFEI